MLNRRFKSFQLLTAAVLLVVVAAACSPGDPGRSTGSYPIDIFQEMHYNQSVKSQEPPRFLPPEGSYPIEGGFIPVSAIEDVDSLENPLAGDPVTLRRAAFLFAQNCSACHGFTANGDGPTGVILATYGINQPPAFGEGDGVVVIRKTATSELTPGKAFGSISGGFGAMPAFERLLTETDRWALVALIDATVAERQTILNVVNSIPEEDRTLELLGLRGQL